MPFQPGNSHGKHANHRSNYNPQQFAGNRWMNRNGAALRVPAENVEERLTEGWTFGRLEVSEETRERQASSQKKRTDRVRAEPHARRNTSYKTRYKRTVKDYDTTMAEQGGHCALCPSTGSVKRRLCWDHNHDCCKGYRSCGKCMRGLLCIGCNKKVGHLEEFLKFGTFAANPDNWANAAMQYLTKYPLTIA